MDRVGSVVVGDLDEERRVEVRLRRRRAGQAYREVGLGDVGQPGVGVAVDRDRLDAERAAGPEDAGGDLDAVRDEHSADHDGPYILKTP
ncbi:hypothetical protein GCM10009562_10120 [Nocardioides aquaticus]